MTNRKGLAAASSGDEMLAIASASRLLGVSTRTLERWTADGLVPAYRLPNGHRRFRRGDIEALLKTSAS